MLSYGAVTSKPPNKQSFISHMKSDVTQSILLHPHVKRVASKVIMEEKAGGFCGIFLRAIHHSCPHLITRTQHKGQENEQALQYSVNINSFCQLHFAYYHFVSILALLRTQIAQLMKAALNI